MTSGRRSHIKCSGAVVFSLLALLLVEPMVPAQAQRRTNRSGFSVDALDRRMEQGQKKLSELKKAVSATRQPMAEARVESVLLKKELRTALDGLGRIQDELLDEQSSDSAYALAKTDQESAQATYERAKARLLAKFSSTMSPLERARALSSDREVQTAQKQLSTTTFRVNQLQKDLCERSPEWVQAKDQTAALKAKIVELDRSIKRASTRLSSLLREQAQLERGLRGVSAVKKNLAAAKRGG